MSVEEAPTRTLSRRLPGATVLQIVPALVDEPAASTELASIYQGALARGHRVITESEYAADLVIKRHDVADDRIDVIPRSIDTARFDPTAVSAERIAVLRHGWGIRPGWRVVLV